MKEYWKDKDKRKGLLGTILFHGLLLLLFFFIGLTYLEPKPEKGILINFGNSATGMGEKDDGSAVNTPTPPTPSQNQSTEKPAESENEPVQTQNTVEAPAIKENSTSEESSPAEEQSQEPQPSDELSRLLENVQNTREGGEGVEEGEGDQGDPDGDPDSPNRTGNTGGGGGGDGNYMLGNREALAKPRPDPCPDNNDVGRVVVKIYVNRNGNVTRAEPGSRIPNGKASTTTSGCLYNEARSAAMRTTWQSDPDAPEVQVGYIIYNFGKR